LLSAERAESKKHRPFGKMNMFFKDQHYSFFLAKSCHEVVEDFDLPSSQRQIKKIPLRTLRLCGE
jgi:hypothetical protein